VGEALKNGTSFSVGVFTFGGVGPGAGGASVSVGESTVVAGKGFAGEGFGTAKGVQICSTKTSGC
jgi:hypothetical protein